MENKQYPPKWEVDFSNPNANNITTGTTTGKPMENKQTAVEYLIEQLEPAITLQSKYIKEYFDKAMEMEKQQIVDFVEWLTRVDSPYSIMYGGEPERLSTLNEDFTIKEVYEEYLKSK